MNTKVELIVDGCAIGFVKNVEYTRDAVEQPSSSLFRRFEPSDYVRIDVELDRPLVTEKWVLLNDGEKVEVGDEAFSPTLCTWTSIPSCKVGMSVANYHVVRRKALVLG